MSLSRARELVELLRQFALAEIDDEREDLATDELQMALVPLVGSSDAERVEYARYEFQQVSVITVQGLALIDAGELLSHVVRDLDEHDLQSLDAANPSLALSPEQFRAAKYAIYWLLNAIEWESRDAKIDAEYPPDERERMLASRLRSLNSFRRTGEP